MRIIRRDDRLIIGSKDFLYGMMTASIILIVLGLYAIYNGYTSKSAIYVGIIVIIIALLIPVKNIVLDYKKKELSITRESIIPVFSQKKVFPINNIKKIYPEFNTKENFSFTRTRLILLDKNGQSIILYRSQSGDDVFASGYKCFERVANVLEDKIKELKK